MSFNFMVKQRESADHEKSGKGRGDRRKNGPAKRKE